MKYLLIVITGTFLLCCNQQPKSPAFIVEHKGALKNFMMNGDISAKVSLSDFKDRNNFYALGALQNLTGEIQIFNSQPQNTIVVDSNLTVDRTFDNNASLLVYATVENWKTITIPI